MKGAPSLTFRRSQVMDAMGHVGLPEGLQDAVAVALTSHREVDPAHLASVFATAGVPPREAVRVLDRLEDTTVTAL